MKAPIKPDKPKIVIYREGRNAVGPDLWPFAVLLLAACAVVAVVLIIASSASAQST